MCVYVCVRVCVCVHVCVRVCVCDSLMCGPVLSMVPSSSSAMPFNIVPTFSSSELVVVVVEEWEWGDRPPAPRCL